MKSLAQSWKLRLIGACGAALLAAPAAYAQAVLSTSVSPATVTPGAPLSVAVTIADIVDLFGYQFSLAFNPAVLQATSVTEGSFLSGAGATFFGSGTINNGAGTISFVFDALLGSVPGASGSGVLVNVGFDAVQAGSSTLTFSDVLFVDSNSATLALQAQSGLVTVVPEPGPALLLAAGLAGLAWRRRLAARPAA